MYFLNKLQISINWGFFLWIIKNSIPKLNYLYLFGIIFQFRTLFFFVPYRALVRKCMCTERRISSPPQSNFEIYEYTNSIQKIKNVVVGSVFRTYEMYGTKKNWKLYRIPINRFFSYMVREVYNHHSLRHAAKFQNVSKFKIL